MVIEAIIEIFHMSRNGKRFQFVDGNTLVTMIALLNAIVVIPLKCLSARKKNSKVLFDVC